VSFKEKIGVWLVDYGYLLYGSLLGIFYRKPPRRYITDGSKEKPHIILIPGVFNTWAFMKFLADEISRAGYVVHTIPELGYNTFDISYSARIVSEVIEKSDCGKIILVAHSKGGLIGKYFLAHHNANKRVSGMVSIATPYCGSALVKFLPIKALRELEPGSALILDLEKYKGVNGSIVSIFSEYDNHIWSKKGSLLEGAENKQMTVDGHHRILFIRETAWAVLDSIKKLS